MENYAEYKEKYEEISAEYEKEKEQLTKLYHLYEETDNDCRRLKEETKNWYGWYNSNKDIFNKLFSTTPPFSVTTDNWTSETVTPSESPIEDIPGEPKNQEEARI